MLGRKRRNLEAFLEEAAAELDSGNCLETVCGAGRRVRKARAHGWGMRGPVWKKVGAAEQQEAGQSLAPPPSVGVCEVATPKEVAVFW